MTFVVSTSKVFARIKFSASPFCLKSTSRRKYTVLNQQGKKGYRVSIVFPGRGVLFRNLSLLFPISLRGEWKNRKGHGYKLSIGRGCQKIVYFALTEIKRKERYLFEDREGSGIHL